MRAQFDDQGRPALEFDHNLEEDQILVEQGVWGVHWDGSEMKAALDTLPESTDLHWLEFPIEARVNQINETVRVVGEDAIRLFTKGWATLAWHHMHSVSRPVASSEKALSTMKENVRYAFMLTGAVSQALELLGVDEEATDKQK